MQYKLIGDNIEVSVQEKQLIEDKLIDPLDKLLKDFEEDTKTADITLIERGSPGKPGYVMSFNMWLPGKERIYAKKKHEKLENLIVILREAIETQIKKYKDKLNSYKK